MTILALPLLLLWMGASEHVHHTRTTAFCLSCHAMHPYGQSLEDSRQGLLAAAHFENALVPRDEGCYSCHTQYTLYGGLEAKLKGLKHMWRAYITQPMDPIQLYDPYANRECLHCHENARSFRENAAHANPMETILEGGLSCLACHAPVHAVQEGDVRAAASGEGQFQIPAEVERAKEREPTWME